MKEFLSVWGFSIGVCTVVLFLLTVLIVILLGPIKAWLTEKRQREQKEEEIREQRKQQIQNLQEKIESFQQQLSSTESEDEKKHLQEQTRQLQNQLEELLETEKVQKTNTRKVWIGVGITALVGIILYLVGFKDPAVILFSILLIWVGATLKIIKKPEVGFLFQLGNYKGQLDPGPHLGLPFLWEIEIRTTATQQITFEEEMYTEAKKEITLKGGIYYKLVDPEKAITLPKDIVESRIKNVVISKLKFEIGKKSFQELLTCRGDIEKEVNIASSTDIKPDGYRVTGVEIADLKEIIESKAAKIREIGEAEAEVDGKKAKAIADSLKGNNYPAAIAMVAGTIGDKIVGEVLKSFKKKQPEGEGGK